MTIPAESDERITAACRDAGIAELAPMIVSLARCRVRLVLHEVSGEQPVVGRTKVGGAPDLARSADWPRWRDRPLSFLAQIELKTLSGFPGVGSLPTHGLLSFFYDPLQETWGFNPEDAGSWQVIWTADESLVTHPHPPDLPREGRFETCDVELVPDVSLPPADSIIVDSLELSQTRLEQYARVEDQLRGDAEPGEESWLLGYAEPIQGDMQLECALVTNGLYCGDTSGYDDPRSRVFKQQAPSWQLLLQLGSEEKASMMWGDVGCLYFWIHEQDLARRHFDNVWMVLQCG